MLTHVAHPVVGTSGTPVLTASKVEEGSGEAERRGIDRGTPPVEGPWRAVRTARNRSASARSREPCNRTPETAWRATSEAPRCGEVSGAIRYAPEDQTNHIPARPGAPRSPRKGGMAEQKGYRCTSPQGDAAPTESSL
jgi:hypothetical protein